MKNYENPLYPALLTEIRKGLSEGKFSQAQIGEKLGIKQSAVSTLMSGRTQLSTNQLLNLCDLLGTRLQNLARQAEISVAETIPMTPQIEDIIYKSDLHVLCYSASTQEITPSQVRLKNIKPSKIQECFEDLLSVGVIKQIGSNSYIQTKPNATLTPTHRLRTTKAHQMIAQKSALRHDEMRGNNSLPKPSFNWYELDRLTRSQVTEIESIFYKLWEKISAFQTQNQAETYNSQDPMLLWNIHMMLMPATDEPHV